MKYDNQLRQAKEIITSYHGNIPLAGWLKEYFRQHKNAGSRDRKTLSTIVYSWYRLGHLPFASDMERLKAAIALSPGLAEWKQYFNTGEFVPTKLDGLFPWTDKLSDKIDPPQYVRSFLDQPNVYLRIRPGKIKIVTEKLKQASISYEVPDENCLSLPSSSHLDGIIVLDQEAVVQDKNSQRIGELMQHAAEIINKPGLNVWDCCAASGGKSIMAHDLLRVNELTVTDVRESILHNLDARFSRAGIQRYRSYVADLTKNINLPHQNFDLVIADVPCTGSGTWSRTPEQMYFFEEKRMEHYVALQRSIVKQVMRLTLPKTIVLYVTCSVFRAENEGMLEYMNTLGCKTIVSETYAGYNEKADTMFGALLTNSAA